MIVLKHYILFLRAMPNYIKVVLVLVSSSVERCELTWKLINS